MIEGLLQQINQVDSNLNLKRASSVGGGCISQAFRVYSENKSYFLKVNDSSLLEMFEAEFFGLQEMAQTAIKTPTPILFEKTASHAFILMEDCPMGGRGDWRLMGRQLAEMHQMTKAKHGWDRTNTIGATPQLNPWMSDWVEFYSEARLGYQIELARSKGLPLQATESLLQNLTKFFDSSPAPSLLHGDLWSGNADFTKSGDPIIFDPATHYGDRECDLAMTEMFGGFPEEFYRGYDEVWPVDKGYQNRKDLYQLYHVLNHYNLFGGGYGQQSEMLVARLNRL